MDHLNNSEKSLFRFETLQYYDVGVNDLSDSEMIPWWEFIKNKTSKENVIMQRVRLIRYPVTEYTKNELEVHKKSIAYGDDIRVVDGDAFDAIKNEEQKLNGINIDINFWLVDDEECLEMNYDKDGKWLGFEVSNDIEKYIKN